MKKSIKELIMPIGIILAGITSIVFAILCFTYHSGVYGTTFTKYAYYGGDAYTGIQQAAADTARNIHTLNYNMNNFLEQICKCFGFLLLVIGILVILYGIGKIFEKKRNGCRKENDLE